MIENTYYIDRSKFFLVTFSVILGNILIDIILIFDINLGRYCFLCRFKYKFKSSLEKTE